MFIAKPLAIFITCLIVEFFSVESQGSPHNPSPVGGEDSGTLNGPLTLSVIEDHQLFLQRKMNDQDEGEDTRDILGQLIDFQRQFMDLDYDRAAFNEKIGHELLIAGFNPNLVLFSNDAVVFSALTHIYIMNKMFDGPVPNGDFFSSLFSICHEPRPSGAVLDYVFKTYASLLKCILDTYERAMHHQTHLKNVTDFLPPSPTPPPSPVNQRSDVIRTHIGA